MKAWHAAALIAIAAACSSLPADANGVVSLQLQLPDSLFLYRTQTLQLHATALNLAGDPVAGAAVTFHTSDPTLVTVDSITGVVTSLSALAATAHVQARSGTLVSDPVLITLRADTTVATSLHQR
jgi:uncharacterized protein YjdB